MLDVILTPATSVTDSEALAADPVAVPVADVELLPDLEVFPADLDDPDSDVVDELDSSSSSSLCGRARTNAVCTIKRTSVDRM